MSHHTLALQCEDAPLNRRITTAGDRLSRRSEGERRIQAGPDGPATSIVSTRDAPSRQGPAPDTSSASASPALTALAVDATTAPPDRRTGP